MHVPVKYEIQKGLLLAIALVVILAYIGLFITYPRSATSENNLNQKTSNYSMPHLIPMVKQAAGY